MTTEPPFVNLYADGTYGRLWSTREEADAEARGFVGVKERRGIVRPKPKAAAVTPARHSDAWPPETVAMMIKLFNEGRTASYIAKWLGPAYTRSAVIGKLHRLKVTRNGKASSGRSGAAVTKTKAVRRSRLARPSNREHLPPIPAVWHDAEAANDERPAAGVSLLDVKSDQCRYPYGDPKDADFILCGAPVLAGRPYCAKHCKRCYQSLPPKSLMRLSEIDASPAKPDIAVAVNAAVNTNTREEA